MPVENYDSVAGNFTIRRAMVYHGCLIVKLAHLIMVNTLRHTEIYPAQMCRPNILIMVSAGEAVNFSVSIEEKSFW